MAIHALIPWSGEDPDRQRALSYVTDRWTEISVRVSLGEIDGEWCKAKAIERAWEIAQPRDDDVVIVADADVWCLDPLTAVAHLNRHRWAIPHRHVVRIDAPTTHKVIDDVLPLSRVGSNRGGATTSDAPTSASPAAAWSPCEPPTT